MTVTPTETATAAESDTHAPSVRAPTAVGRSGWLAVGAVGFGIFALVTTEFLPASLLPRIAADMGTTEGAAGQAVTATAVMGALTAPTIAAIVPRLDRRYLLIALTALGLLSNVLVAVAPSYWLLLASRVLLGAALAGFWAMALAVVGSILPADRMGRGMTIVNVGVSLATVVAVPLGTYLGEAWGWRPVFWLAAGLSLVALLALAAWLPSVAPSGAPGLRTVIATARTRAMTLGLIAIGLVAGGHFAAFTYVRPAAELVPDMDPERLALLLTIFGLGTFVGTVISGQIADRRLRLGILIAPIFIGASTSAFALVAGSYVAVAVTVAVWGAAFGGVPTLVMTWIARVEPDRLEAAGSLATGMFQVAIASGAAVGGVLLDVFDVRVALLIAGAAAAVGGVLFASARKV
ncbi:MFS transporter [Virgisporangium aurantiacum]|uniref:MFS transporter n=1 Tax=Virgisporangium aurantiacum TaxID=175570 RepID=A0A8J3ZGI0_9ACTN|nr:MFS transporter [Virgisporangium aurantiacum]GIJ61440.1 MFS transporter [Virgisporangium aurantiacum]